MSMKNPNDNRTSDLPICSTAPEDKQDEANSRFLQFCERA